MDAERWHRLSGILQEALEHPPERRTAFLDDACGEDSTLRAEVTSLLAYHDQTNELMDTPTQLVGTELPDAGPSESLVGHTLHQYAVTEKLGEGGMGVVYRADDTRLGRLVAIKALSRQFTQNAERRERLRREARAAAALSHPGIATVYALEEFDDALYIVSEYVRGRTLRDEVTTGPVPGGPLLDTGIEIARALAVAHRHGVIHRDLKPENVIRTAEGHVKILDFGLARIENSPGGLAASTTRLTEPGTVLGTPVYMPPEQLRGQEVDFRGDIFSFGVLLYELASGTHPFTSSNPASTIARVLESDPPDVTQLSHSCPAGLDQLIGTCLQKDPAQRFSSTDVLLEKLQELRRDLVETETGRPLSAQQAATGAGSRRRSPSPLWWWQCHQAVVGLGYYLMLIPLWNIRAWIPGAWGSRLFFAAVAAVGVAATLRFHLWFTSRFYRTELAAQRRQSFWLIRGADWLFVSLLLVGGVLLAGDHAGFAALLVSVAIGTFIGFTIIEPATTRAAFKRRRSKASGSRAGRKTSKSGRRKET